MSRFRCSFCLDFSDSLLCEGEKEYTYRCQKCGVDSLPRLKYSVPIENLSEKTFPFSSMKFLLLDKGFISLVRCSGNEDDIIRAAKVCVGSDLPISWGEEEKLRFLSKLYRWGHLTPFEHINLTFHLSCPIFVFRQWVRHRTASINELSGRYAPCLDKEITSITSDVSLLDDIRDLYERIDSLYAKLIEAGVSKENARIILPLATYTRAIWTIDLRNLLHFLDLRCHKSAQSQIREYALVIRDYILQDVLPLVWKVYRRTKDEEGTKKGGDGGE